ncbi:MAG TPA: hypothetical protein VNM67_05470 [Thermoanaerobaculia bacterium]|jgi:hypothetical protein|nr:hypothetical protein [Thermoanaerobaculia bacterium]
MTRQTSLLLLGLALALAVPWQARATTLVTLDLEQLADRAELVFTGTAVSSEVALTPEDQFPFTFVTFRVESTLKGRAEGKELTLRFAGGPVGEDWVEVVGMPEFAIGEEYLLFVSGNGVNLSPVLGWHQGRLRVARDPESGRKVLVDEAGAPVLGIERGRWVLGVPQHGLGGKAELVDQEGVVITAERPGPVRRARPDAGQVVQSLRSFLHSRGAKPTFAPGRTVRSASPSEIPARMGGDVAAPRQ